MNVAVAIYLYRQTRSDLAKLDISERRVETAGWLSGVVTSLAASALLVGVIVVPLVIFLGGLGGTRPGTATFGTGEAGVTAE